MIMERPLNRVEPALPAGLMQTHQIAMPLPTHWRRATCEEVGCLAFRHGWQLARTGLDDEDMALLAKSKRRWREEQGDDGPVLIFEAGQPCLAASEHRIQQDRPPLFIARDGDFRGNPRQTEPVVFSGADPFADHLHTHLEKFDH